MPEGVNPVPELSTKEAIILVRLVKPGVVGWVIIGILVVIPTVIITYPKVKKQNKL